MYMKSHVAKGKLKINTVMKSTYDMPYDIDFELS